MQLKELEKILNDGQVFTEFQKLERRSEVSGLKRDTLASGFSWQTTNLRMSRDDGLAVAFAVCSLLLNGRKG